MFARTTCRIIKLQQNTISRRLAPQHQQQQLLWRPRICISKQFLPTIRCAYQQQRPTTTPTTTTPTAARPIAVGINAIWRNMFGKYLLVTNIVSSGLLMVVGDMMAQEIENKPIGNIIERYDYKRMWRMFVAGALQGPLHHFVYGWMDRLWVVPTFRNITKKILIDQLFMSPACILIFFYSACYLERKTLKETNDELSSKFLFIYIADWLLWPGAQYINFRYLDTKYRVMFVNVCTALYNVFLSYVKHDFNFQLF